MSFLLRAPIEGRRDADDDCSGAAGIPENIARRDDLDDDQWEAVRVLEEEFELSDKCPNGPERDLG